VDILNHYFGISTLPILINNPLRTDKNASLSVFLNDSDNVILKDFGSHKSYNLWSFLMKLWNLKYDEVLEKIIKDLKNINSTLYQLKSKNFYKKKHSKSILECKIRDWKPYDLQYWESFGISLPWLKFGEVYPISHTFITKDDKKYTFRAEKYAYAYVERKDGIVTLKIYQPKSINRKWCNSGNASVWDLWSQLPKTGDKLFITSSRKDALCLWENTLIPAISMQGEGYIPKQSVIDELKNRFKNIYIFFDNDFDKEENHGRQYAQFLSKMFNIPYIEIPDEYKVKDPSDFVNKYSRNELKQLVNKLI
jgi:hypothetical protein